MKIIVAPRQPNKPRAKITPETRVDVLLQQTFIIGFILVQGFQR